MYKGEEEQKDENLSNTSIESWGIRKINVNILDVRCVATISET